ncbi:hypothetical protein E4T56_gene18002, partial [Termitomyces sp. T112]
MSLMVARVQEKDLYDRLHELLETLEDKKPSGTVKDVTRNIVVTSSSEPHSNLDRALPPPKAIFLWMASIPTRLRALALYKELHRLGRDYPDPSYDFHGRIRRLYEKHRNLTDPEEIEKALRLADYIKK